jgi:hypothetical protein
MSYEIGQVIYLMANEKMEIIPLLVTEIQTTKTANGVVTSYSVLPPGSNPEDGCVKLSKAMELGEVFSNLNDARSVMLERATQAIDRIVGSAQVSAAKFRAVSPSQVLTSDIQERLPAPPAPTIDTYDSDIPQTVTLPDGRVAKVNVKVGAVQNLLP